MKIIRLDIDGMFGGDHNSAMIGNLVNDFSDILYAGKGPKPSVLSRYNIGMDFPLRCMVGIPEPEFGIDKKRIAEAYLGIISPVPIKGNIWTDQGFWNPVNKNKKDAPLDKSVFDINFALTLGMTTARWEEIVLMNSTIVMRQEKIPNRAGTHGHNARMVLALAAYGFYDPMQFFTANLSKV